MARPSPPFDEQRIAEASAWRVRLSDARLETSPAFERWLKENPANLEAWAETQALWSALGEHASAPEMVAARSMALQRTRAPSPRCLLPLGLQTPRLAGGLAASLLLASALGYAVWTDLAPQTYRTAHGERRVVALADGSRAMLDSDSLLKVRLVRDARRLDLVRGQARFDVAHDAARPFEVRAGERTVIATGTSFEVEHRGAAVRVVLIEGRVNVVDEGPGRESQSVKRPPLRLSPGQRLTANTASPTTRIEPVDLDRVTSWEEGRLDFDDQPLSEVTQVVSRYTAKPVRVADPRAAALRVSGVFRAGDLATFVDTVTRYLPVRSQETGDAVILRSSGPPPA